MYVLLDSGEGGRGLGLRRESQAIHREVKELMFSTQMFTGSWNDSGSQRGQTEKALIKQALLSSCPLATPGSGCTMVMVIVLPGTDLLCYVLLGSLGDSS